ncbi:FAD-dependent oxidoreductase, partial [Gordonia sp. 852002-10350_SCH5691597]|uniref:FAD-dependent oxidoreductase n=2 Tax=Gordonia TaxID=2053 RepID=UPI0018D36944
MSATAGVVIVGAGLGAIRVAENLRADGYDKPITLIGAEPHPPYDRPPLSKSVLLGKDDRVDLKPAAFYTDSDITLRLGTTVGSVDTDAKTVSVVDEAGERSVVEYDTLVLATGLRPRAFPGTDAMSGVHTLRTFADALAV